MKRVKVLISLLPAIILLALPKFALAETATFEAEKDSFANQAYPSTAYGSHQFMTVSNKPIDRLAFIKFQDPALPEGAILDQATLKFYVYEQSYASQAKMNVGPVIDDWEESSLTWNNKPAVNQSQATEATILLATGWKEVGVTHLVRQWSEGSLANKGLFIYPFGYLYGTSEGDFATSLKSREAAGLGAQLVVEYHFEPTPTPTAVITPETTSTEAIETVAFSPTPTETEETTPSPAESPTATPEAEEKKPFLSLSPGQTVIAGIIILALIGAGIAFALSFGKKAKKKPESKEKKGEITEKEEASW